MTPILDQPTQLKFPADWLIIEPPDGIEMIAIEPEPTGAVRASIVATTTARRLRIGASLASEIDSYLVESLDALADSLHDVELHGVWTNTDTDQPVQRVALRHCSQGQQVEMVQQHIWAGDHVIVITVTVACDVDDALVACLDECLSAPCSSPLQPFTLWEPAHDRTTS
jgi:hypothetical protein